MVGIREDRRGNIHLGDVIIAINGNPVADQDQLLTVLESLAPGDKITVTSMREEEIETYDANTRGTGVTIKSTPRCSSRRQLPPQEKIVKKR